MTGKARTAPRKRTAGRTKNQEMCRSTQELRPIAGGAGSFGLSRISAVRDAIPCPSLSFPSSPRVAGLPLRLGLLQDVSHLLGSRVHLRLQVLARQGVVEG